MAPFSKRTTIVSLILNVLFFFSTMGLFTYALMQKTVAESNKAQIEQLEQLVLEQKKIA